MSETTAAPATPTETTALPGTATAAPGIPAAPATPWYQGKADAETIGYWQNKAWKHDDPISVALEATKAAREAQKFVGAPPEQLLKLPKDASDEAGWNTVHQRLGKPSDPKAYDFTDVKLADGTAIDAAFADTIRKLAFDNHLSKDAATAFARGLTKFGEQVDAADGLETKTNFEASMQRLKDSWGTEFERNFLSADQAAQKLSITKEDSEKMMRAIGADKVAEMFRKIGAGMKEDRWVEGSGSQGLATREAALEERNRLAKDKDFGKKLQNKDAQATRHWNDLNERIAGVVDTSRRVA